MDIGFTVQAVSLAVAVGSGLAVSGYFMRGRSSASTVKPSERAKPEPPKPSARVDAPEPVVPIYVPVSLFRQVVQSSTEAGTEKPSERKSRQEKEKEKDEEDISKTLIRRVE